MDKRKISKIVGLAQASVGAAAIIFAFIFFYNILAAGVLDASETHVGLYLWVLIIFGLLSIISGLLLFYEQ